MMTEASGTSEPRTDLKQNFNNDKIDPKQPRTSRCHKEKPKSDLMVFGWNLEWEDRNYLGLYYCSLLRWSSDKLDSSRNRNSSWQRWGFFFLLVKTHWKILTPIRQPLFSPLLLSPYSLSRNLSLSLSKFSLMPFFIFSSMCVLFFVCWGPVKGQKWGFKNGMRM